MVTVCECCKVFKSVGVAAIPGVPMSIAWCRECLRFGAIPEWVVKYWVGGNGGWKGCADWVPKLVVPVGPLKYAFAGEIIDEERAIREYNSILNEIERV